jgi:hypothetical protein
MVDAEAGHLLPVLTTAEACLEGNIGHTCGMHQPLCLIMVSATGQSSTGLLVGVFRIRPCPMFLFPVENCGVCA